MSPESPESPSGNMGINWDSRGPAVTKNRGCEETYQGELRSTGLFAVGRGKIAEIAYRSDTRMSHALLVLFVFNSFLKNLYL